MMNPMQSMQPMGGPRPMGPMGGPPPMGGQPMQPPMQPPMGGPQAGFSVPASGINLFKVQEQLKDMPPQVVMAYANGQNPSIVPPYVALGEMERRTRAAKSAQPTQAPTGTVKDALTQGLASLGGMAPQAQPASPEPRQDTVYAARGGLAAVPVPDRMTNYRDGGIVGYAGGEDVKLPPQPTAAERTAQLDRVRLPVPATAAERAAELLLKTGLTPEEFRALTPDQRAELFEKMGRPRVAPAGTPMPSAPPAPGATAAGATPVPPAGATPVPPAPPAPPTAAPAQPSRFQAVRSALQPTQFNPNIPVGGIAKGIASLAKGTIPASLFGYAINTALDLGDTSTEDLRKAQGREGDEPGLVSDVIERFRAVPGMLNPRSELREKLAAQQAAKTPAKAPEKAVPAAAPAAPSAATPAAAPYASPARAPAPAEETKYAEFDPSKPATGSFDLSPERLSGTLAAIQKLPSPDRERAMQAITSQLSTERAGLGSLAPANPATDKYLNLFTTERDKNEDLIKRIQGLQAPTVDSTPVEQNYLKRLEALYAKRGEEDVRSRADIEERRRMDLSRALFAGAEATRGQSGLGSLASGFGRSALTSREARMGEEAALRNAALDREALLEKARYDMEGLQRARAEGNAQKVADFTKSLLAAEAKLREAQTPAAANVASSAMGAANRGEYQGAALALRATEAENKKLRDEAAAELKNRALLVQARTKAQAEIDKRAGDYGSKYYALYKDPAVREQAVKDRVKELLAEEGVKMPEDSGAPTQQPGWKNLEVVRK